MCFASSAAFSKSWSWVLSKTSDSPWCARSCSWLLATVITPAGPASSLALTARFRQPRRRQALQAISSNHRDRVRVRGARGVITSTREETASMGCFAMTELGSEGEWKEEG